VVDYRWCWWYYRIRRLSEGGKERFEGMSGRGRGEREGKRMR
jgi:hypothetical protein